MLFTQRVLVGLASLYHCVRMKQIRIMYSCGLGADNSAEGFYTELRTQVSTDILHTI